MSRLVIPLFFLLFLTSSVSATYYIKQGGFLYEIRYSVFSNGTSALVDVEIDNYGITCGMDSCWAEVYDVYDYLLFFDDSRLYLLNFTPALLSNLPPYAPRNISWVYFNGVKYVNGSWYVNMSVFTYSAKTQNASKLHYIFRLDTGNFCIKKVSVGWSRLKGSMFKSEINGWRIEIPEEFRAKYVFINGTWVQVGNKTEVRIPPSADFFLIAKHKVENSSYCRPLFSHQRPVIANWTQFPVYFVLKKNGQVKNVTILYINTTNTINGYWFPDSVRIVNVTICKRATNTTTSTTTGIETTPRSNATKTKIKGICGPGFVVLIILSVLLLNKRRW